MGLGFRPGVKVDTFSPAYALRDHLAEVGAIATLEDPYYSDAELQQAGFEPGRAPDAAMIVLNTAHPEFSRPDFEAWRAAGVEVVLDGRNLWKKSEVEAAGINYFGIGQSSRFEGL